MGKFLDVSAQIADPRGIFIGDSGTKLFVCESARSIYRYTLSTAWDISTGSFDTGQSLALGGATTPQDIWFKSDGTKFYFMDNAADTVQQYTLSTAWDLTSATSDGGYSVNAEEAGPKTLALSPDGTKMYVSGAVSNTVYQYTITTAHDITGTVTYASKSMSHASQVVGNGLYVEDGTNDYVLVGGFSEVDRYSLSTSFDISTGSFDTGQVFTYTEDPGNCLGVFFSDDGTSFYTGGAGAPEKIYQYELSTAWDVTTAAFDPPNLADGAVTLAQTVSGTASTDHQYADGAVTVTPTVVATVTNNTLHADGAVATAQTISATGAPSLHADSSVTITPTIAAGATSISAIVGDMTMAAMTMEGFIEYTIMTIPAMQADAVMTQDLPSGMTMPALTIAGEINPGAFAEGLMALPLLEVDAAGDNTADITLPSLVAEGAMLSSSVVVGQMHIPALILSSGLGDDRFLDDNGVLSLPSLTMVGNSVNSPIVDGNMTIPLLTAFGVNAAGTVATGVAALPIFTMDSLVSALVSAGLMTADLTLPALEAQGYMQITATLTHSGWVFNTESLRTSEYDNYNYVLVANAFGKTIGVAADGIYELTGDTDNTVDIDADVLFGFDSFRTEDLKRVKAVHIGYRADNAGDLSVQIVVDGEDKIREYSVKHVSSTSGLKRGRATPAKGLKSRYWQYGVKNVAGADFTIDDLSIFVQQHNRKV